MGQVTVAKPLCAGCGQELDEDPGAPVETREPCSGCGSILRHIAVHVEDTITIHESTRVQGRHGTSVKPFAISRTALCAGADAVEDYSCVGDIKKAWATACKRAGFPVGRTAGGYVFHHTRNSAATNLRAGGMEEADAMKITDHTTTHVFRHYDVGDVEALRERLARAREQKRARPTTSVTPIRVQG